MSNKNSKPSQLEPILYGIAGAWGLSMAFRHRRLLKVAAITGAVGYLFKRFLDSAESPCWEKARKVEQLHLGSPSFQGDEEAHSTQEPYDEIDEAMMESFPASDPPASYHRA